MEQRPDQKTVSILSLKTAAFAFVFVLVCYFRPFNPNPLRFTPTSDEMCAINYPVAAFTPSCFARPQSHIAHHQRLCLPQLSPGRSSFSNARRPRLIHCTADTAQPGVAPPVPPIPVEKNPVDIIALRDNWVAVNKPPSILVHRTKLYRATPGETYLVDEVRRAIEAIHGAPVNVLPVQRLDRPTSGVMVFALGDSKSASQLQNALQSEDSRKEYWTLAYGADMPEKWENHHPLRDLTGKTRKQRPASSTFEQLLRLNDSDISVVRARIATGRRHQIRRHLSNSRHAVLGDTSYGKGAMNRNARELYGVPRCCLHSRRITFVDPTTREQVTFEAPVPQDLRDVLARLPDCDEHHEGLLDLGTLK